MPRPNLNNTAATTSSLRGPRPPAKPAMWRSAPVKPSPSSPPSSAPERDSRDDLVSPMQQRLNLGNSSANPLQDNVRRLQTATGSVVAEAAATAEPSSPSPGTSGAGRPVAPAKMDAFEASLAPRKRQSHVAKPMVTTTSPATTTTTPSVSATPVSPTAPVPPRPAPAAPSAPTSAVASTPTAPAIPPAPAPATHAAGAERVRVANPLYTGVQCAGCEQPISGRVIRVDHNQWHVDCFKCRHCGQDLEHVAFYSKDGQPYCALDYHELFSTRCDYCGTPIEEVGLEGKKKKKQKKNGKAGDGQGRNNVGL